MTRLDFQLKFSHFQIKIEVQKEENVRNLKYEGYETSERRYCY